MRQPTLTDDEVFERQQTRARVMLGTWGVDTGSIIEERIITVLRKRGPMARRDLWHATKNQRRYNAEQWGKALKALKEVGVVDADPSDVHFLTEMVARQ